MPDTDPLGQTVSHYRILHKVGGGGMGVDVCERFRGVKGHPYEQGI